MRTKMGNHIRAGNHATNHSTENNGHFPDQSLQQTTRTETRNSRQERYTRQDRQHSLILSGENPKQFQHDWHNRLERRMNTYTWLGRTLHYRSRALRTALMPWDSSTGSVMVGITGTKACLGCGHMRWDGGLKLARCFVLLMESSFK